MAEITLSMREQAEGQQNLVPLPAEALLHAVGVDQCAVGDAVRNHHDRARIGAIDAHQNVAADIGHHDHPRGTLEQSFHHPTLIVIRVFEDRVKRDDHGDRQPIEQRQQILARGPAINAVFVLDPNRLRAARFDRPGGRHIGQSIFLGDRSGHFGRTIIALGAVVHRIDVDLNVGETILQREIRISRICRDAALARQEIPNQRKMFGARHLRRRRHFGPFTSSFRANSPFHASLNGSKEIWLHLCCIATKESCSPGLISRRDHPRPR
jgi:hypothetical protein